MVSKNSVKPKKIRKKPRKSGVKTKNFSGGLKGWMQKRFKGRSRILVEMTYNNGTISHYTILKDGNKFKLDGNTYLIDETQKLWDNGSRCFLFRYHEDYALPYFNEVSGNQLKEASVDKDKPKYKTAFSPSVLSDVLRMEYAKGVIQGGEVNALVKKIMFISVLGLVVGVGHVLLAAITQKWLG